jgi:hypothetical protein
LVDIQVVDIQVVEIQAVEIQVVEIQLVEIQVVEIQGLEIQAVRSRSRSRGSSFNCCAPLTAVTACYLRLEPQRCRHGCSSAEWECLGHRQ